METVAGDQFQVRGSMTVSQLVREFKQLFPYLRIEVLYNGNEASLRYPLTALNRLTSRRQLHSFRVHQALTVCELTDKFWDNMGLQIIVGRKLANVNVETTFTSQWTLEMQNKVGSEIFNEFE